MKFIKTPIADVMLIEPQVFGDARGFFMKSVPSHFPDWIKTAEVPKKGGSLTQVLAGHGSIVDSNIIDGGVHESILADSVSGLLGFNARPFPLQALRRRASSSSRR